MPTIGNGYVATFVKSDIIYAGGLFNGDALGALGPVSHRATIPAWHVSWQVAGTQGSDIVQALDVRRAVFTERSSVAGHTGLTAEETWYAPLDKPSLLVHEVTFTGTAGAKPAPLAFSSKRGPPGADLNITMMKPMMGGPARWTGSNFHGELGNSTTLTMISSNVPDAREMSPAAGSSSTYYFITAIVTSLNSSDTVGDATKIYEDAKAGAAGLLASHTAAWAERWEQGSLEVGGWGDSRDTHMMA
jgi:hypothetical protein